MKSGRLSATLEPSSIPFLVQTGSFNDHYGTEDREMFSEVENSKRHSKGVLYITQRELKETLEMELSVNDKKERWIMHYCSSHKILIVGDGDFSFSACLARAFGSATNMIATSLDSKEEVIRKHGKTAPANLKELIELGCTIIHGVDASTMSHHPHLRSRFFDRIVFNFPHAGLFMYRESQWLQIELHKDVVRGFMRSAPEMLTEDGEVHVTHKTAHPFSSWGIEELAAEVGLDLVEKVSFYRGDYPGYINKKGYGSKSNKTFRVGECSTFKFAKHESGD